MATIATTKEYRRNKIHPKKFALWVGLASIMMMFAAFTSAYIVRQASGNWLEFALPNMFFVSTAVIITSSLTVHGSYLAFKKGNEGLYRGLLIVTFILGMVFLALQYRGWEELSASGIELTTNPSGSFIYVISGVHATHVLGGLAILGIALMHAFILPFQVTGKRKLRFELTLTYWHFVDILWIYLLAFWVTQAQ